MNKIIARNRRTGTEYIRVEQGSAGLLRVFTGKTVSGVPALPENIEIFDTPRVPKLRKKTNPTVRLYEPMYKIRMEVKDRETGEVIYRYRAEAPIDYVLALASDAARKGQKHAEAYQLDKKLNIKPNLDQKAEVEEL